ncbi:MAG: lysine 2,3-aminomutase [Micavibrio sp.]|nr:lysine 2,3-aminomutase [Micavibrio sp.]|tara:strand:- start:481 stop:1572 length:1092 start_codon:yes stop_codon:yes gene_type:complete
MSIYSPDKQKITTPHDLMRAGLIWDGDFAAIEAISERYAIGLTQHILDLINANPKSEGVRLQYVPQEAELYTTPTELEDPIGDNAHSPVKGIVHRYPDRVLFKVVSGCPVYCRFCFRREMVGPSHAPVTKEERDKALDYIRANPEIWEVILTGGDPLILSERKIGALLDELCAIEHVKVIRIHTRVPMADPKRLTDDYLKILKEKCTKPLYIVIHANHPNEFNDAVEQTIKNLHEIGANLLSQTALLHGVNDHAGILERLFRKLVTLNVKPYYLHHPDMAKGTSHFRLSLTDGMNIYRTLLGRISGLCHPAYVLDIPGGYGKTPINANYIVELKSGHYIVEDYFGRKHNYVDDLSDNAARSDI